MALFCVVFFFAIQHVYESFFRLGFTCAPTALSAVNMAFILLNAGVQQKATALFCAFIAAMFLRF